LLKTILIIIVSVSIFGILIFSFVRQALKRHVENLIADELINKKNKKKK
jgi:hypothetical protein